MLCVLCSLMLHGQCLFVSSCGLLFVTHIVRVFVCVIVVCLWCVCFVSGRRLQSVVLFVVLFWRVFVSGVPLCNVVIVWVSDVPRC